MPLDISKIAEQFDEPVVVDIAVKHLRVLRLSVRARQRPPGRHQSNRRLRTKHGCDKRKNVGMICNGESMGGVRDRFGSIVRDMGLGRDTGRGMKVAEMRTR
jgi:hypothetical protein